MALGLASLDDPALYSTSPGQHLSVQAAIGLKGLHDSGYLHGDISPYNIAVSVAEDGTTTTTIVDLATLRRFGPPKVCQRPKLWFSSRKEHCHGPLAYPLLKVCGHFFNQVLASAA